ncbi:MAG: CBS domain-containing protein, partial [Deltaproteobacteria bacterium]|nr:CBS domain-containing protein [Deltaproteobacteria bacterium]
MSASRPGDTAAPASITPESPSAEPAVGGGGYAMGRDTNANSQLATYLGTAGDYCPPLSGSALEEAMAITSVKDIMTEVVEALRVGDSLDLADRIMRVGRIRHLPVVDGDDHLVGLVTHRT